MTTRTKRVIACTLIACLTSMGMIQTAGATMIGTEAIARSEAPAAQQRTPEEARAHVLGTLERADVVAALTERGVSVDAARARVAALTDDEAITVAQQIDQAPAAGDGLIGALVFIFVLLLITDILGLTKIFPFTRSVR